MSDTEPTPAQRSTPLMTILFLVVIVGMAGGVFFMYQQWNTQQENYNDSGFNINRIEPEAANPVSNASSSMPETTPPPSSLNMIRTGPGAFHAGSSETRVPPSQSFIQAARKNEGRYEALARRYTAQYPVIRQYGKDWMKYPDLHRFNDEYFIDHDPVKFAKNVAASPNFAALVKQYAHRPEMMAFIQDAAKSAPADLLKSAQDYLKTDSNANGLLERFASAMGLPPAVVAGLLGNGKLNPHQAVGDMLRSNPQLQNVLQQNNIDPNQLNSPLKDQR